MTKTYLSVLSQNTIYVHMCSAALPYSELSILVPSLLWDKILATCFDVQVPCQDAN